MNRSVPFMRKALPIAGAALLLAAVSMPALAGPKLTARTVTHGFVRSNSLLPLGGKKPIANPVPPDLTDLSGWTREELEAGLQKEYDVDVAAVTKFLYSDQGVQFLSESIQGNNYTPYYSQANSVQSVRSAIILDAADGKLSSYGMMARLPVDQRLQGSMKVCNAQNLSNPQQETSLLSWYLNTPACIQAYTAVQEQAQTVQGVRGLW
ncbi:MAG: alpha/beta hydrolase [Synechococcus sp.]|nr:alpha/beta hydrolase [Synechococcus sp.]